MNDCWNTIGVYGDLRERCFRLEEYLHCRYCPQFIQAARQLLHRRLPADYQQELTDITARPPSLAGAAQSGAFIFKTGIMWCAVPAGVMDELIPMTTIHSLPRRSNAIFRGLVPVRGRLELCFSIGGVLQLNRYRDLERQQYSAPKRLVIIRHRHRRFVIPATEVHGMHRYSPAMLRSLPDSFTDGQKRYLRGLLPYQEKDVYLLVLDAVIQAFMESLR